MRGRTSEDCWTVALQTSAGEFVATFTQAGLAQLDFPGENRGAAIGASAVPAQVTRWARQTQMALQEAVNGGEPGELPPLDWTGRPEFQQRVWQALQKIRPGCTRTYGDIAAEVGSPKGARAVGAACGANPIPVLVPCHRVLAAGGGLGGFSGGLDWKRKLLKAENAGAALELVG